MTKRAQGEKKTQYLVSGGEEKNIADFLLTAGINQGIITRSVNYARYLPTAPDTGVVERAAPGREALKIVMDVFPL